MRDHEDGFFSNYIKIRIFLGVAIGFLVSGWYCFEEARYALWGKTTIATVTSVDQPTNSRMVRMIHYSFDDPEIVGKEVLNHRGEIVKSGLTRYEEAQIPSSGSVPFTQFEIEYLPGSTTNSRFAGESRAGRCVPFLVCSLAMIAFVVSFTVDYYKFEKTKAR